MQSPQNVTRSNRLLRRKQFIKEVGVRAYLLHLVYKLLRFFPKEIRLHSPHSLFPIWCRPGTSDIDVFRQIFRDREYDCFDDLVDPHLIIDCGANVGFSSAYFLSRFPSAFVIAVEPNPSNFAMLLKNLKPYAGRFKAIRSAIWSKNSGLIFFENPLGDGRAWSVSVRETQPGEKADLEGVTIDDLLDKSPFKRISILKIDIEGAESEIFSSNYERWLPRVDNMCIEVHGEQAHRIFAQAISGERFTQIRSGELIVCRRTKAPAEV